MEPQLSEINYEAPHDGKSLLLSLNDGVRRLVIDDKYDAWNCLNQHFGLISISVHEDSAATAQIKLKGIYNLDKLASLYGKLPGIESAEPIGATYIAIRRPEFRVVLVNNDWHYVFATISDSNQAVERNGSARRTLHHFVSHGTEHPQDAGTWEESADVAEAPSWAKQYWFGPEYMRAFGVEK